MQKIMCLPEYIQGTEEWHKLRKTKITATDAAVIMGTSHWKTPLQLYHEKLSDAPPSPANERMQRGLDLEPLARQLFCLKTGHKMIPKVVVKDWMMASLDGINYWDEILEIKCPGTKDHSIAISGKVPDHYYPQLQHQMYVCNSEKSFYFSFDGFDGVIVEVLRDNKYIQKLINEEKKFYECLINKTPPIGNYIERIDSEWEEYASKWITLNQTIKELEKQESEIRNRLIELSGQSNSKGFGVTLSQIQRKGNVNYSNIPELKNVDLEKYRTQPTNMWRISLN